MSLQDGSSDPNGACNIYKSLSDQELSRLCDHFSALFNISFTQTAVKGHINNNFSDKKKIRFNNSVLFANDFFIGYMDRIAYPLKLFYLGFADVESRSEVLEQFVRECQPLWLLIY